MSSFHKLVARHSVEGVRHWRLADAMSVVQTSRGIRRSSYGDGAQIPIVDQGQALIAGYTDEEGLALDDGEYVVFGDHTRAVKWVDFKFAVGADGTKVLKAKPGLIPKFAYHAIANLDVPSRGYNRHWTVARDLRIPVPPLPIQHEIVRILDSFTELEEELKAELEARRLQFSYYRDLLISESTDERRPMGEVGQFVRGRRFTKKDIVSSGLPSIHYGEIYTHYGVSASKAVNEVRADLRLQLRFAVTGDVVIACVGETVEEVGKAVAWLGDDDVAIHDDTFLFRSGMDPKFVAYALQTPELQSQKVNYVARAKVKRISGRGLGKIMIPVPSLAEQKRVVKILDKFDALVNDHSSGLPAEITARRKQYVHYRDRLLNFEGTH